MHKGSKSAVLIVYRRCCFIGHFFGWTCYMVTCLILCLHLSSGTDQNCEFIIILLLFELFASFVAFSALMHAVGWVAGRASGLYKIWGDGGGRHRLVWMEWLPAGWSVCLPLLIFPCTIKSRSSLLAPAHPGGPGKRAVKWLCVLFE